MFNTRQAKIGLFISVLVWVLGSYYTLPFASGRPALPPVEAWSAALAASLTLAGAIAAIWIIPISWYLMRAEFRVEVLTSGNELDGAPVILVNRGNRPVTIIDYQLRPAPGYAWNRPELPGKLDPGEPLTFLRLHPGDTWEYYFALYSEGKQWNLEGKASGSLDRRGTAGAVEYKLYSA